jgi:hypothetical protein
MLGFDYPRTVGGLQAISAGSQGSAEQVDPIHGSTSSGRTESTTTVRPEPVEGLNQRFPKQINI